jgi:Flp pilus assembly pilin Flp
MAGRSVYSGPRCPPAPGLAIDERGSTAIEYALLAAVVAIFAIGGLQALGAETGGLYGLLDQINEVIAKALS